MLLYEVLWKPRGKWDEIHNSEFSAKGRRKRNVVLFAGARGQTLVFCQCCEREERAEEHFRVFAREKGLHGDAVSRKEITMLEFKKLLEAAEEQRYVRSADQILGYLNLKLYEAEWDSYSFWEMMAEYETGQPAEAWIAESRRKRYSGLAEELERLLAEWFDSTAAYAFFTEHTAALENQLEFLMRVLHEKGWLASARVCAINPQIRRISRKKLEQIYRNQSRGVVLVRLLPAEVESCVFENATNALRWISLLAEEYRDQVLTVFWVHPGAEPQIDAVENVLKELPLIRIGGKTAAKSRGVPATTQRSHNTVKKAKTASVREKKTDGFSALQNLIGLETVKRVIKQAVDYGAVQQLYIQRGFKPQKLGMHMVFTGNPGTAKTTVARLAAQIFREKGILSEGKLIEVGRSDLVGRYVGWTAAQVKAKFEEARGSVLFIDEAYSLLDEKEGQYGDEAINTIVQEMENHRHDMVVIFAGYKEPMKQFLDRNPGLRSRITFRLDFPDYTEEALMQILGKMLEEHERSILPQTEEHVRKILRSHMNEESFGNGRFVRTLVERSLLAQASRLMQSPFEAISNDEIRYLEVGDFAEYTEERTSRSEKRVIGFAG